MIEHDKARVALIIRLIGRRIYQWVTFRSLRLMDGPERIDLYGLFTPTKNIDRHEINSIIRQADASCCKIWTTTPDKENVNLSAHTAMVKLVSLACDGDYDYYGYTEGDILCLPNWLDELLALRDIVKHETEAQGFRVGIGAPIDMQMDWYEPQERSFYWRKKWMAAQLYLMDREAALHIKLDDPIWKVVQPPSGWDKEMPSRLDEQGFVNFTPKGISWIEHIGLHGVTSSPNWWPHATGFHVTEPVRELYDLAMGDTSEQVKADYER